MCIYIHTNFKKFRGQTKDKDHVNSNLDMFRRAKFIRKQTGPPVVNTNSRQPNYLKCLQMILETEHLL